MDSHRDWVLLRFHRSNPATPRAEGYHSDGVVVFGGRYGVPDIFGLLWE